MLRAGEVARELLQVARFAREVELAPHGPAKLGHRGLRPIRFQFRQLLRQLREPGQNIEIDFHPPANARVLHLHHDIVAARAAAHDAPAQSTPRPAASNRNPQTARRAACPSSDSIVSRTTSGSIARHARLQLLQFLRERHADLIRPRAQNLAQLDERRPKLFDRQPNPRLAAQVRKRLAVAVLQESPSRAARSNRLIQSARPYLLRIDEDLAPAIDVAIDVRDGADFHTTATTLPSLSVSLSDRRPRRCRG